MKRIIIALVTAALIAPSFAQGFERTLVGFKASTGADKTSIELQWFTPKTVRIVKVPHQNMVNKESLSVIAQPQANVGRTFLADAHTIVSKSDDLMVALDTETGIVRFLSADGALIVSELGNDKPFTPVSDAGNPSYVVYQAFDTDNDEGLYGLGQLQNGKMVQRNMVKELFQENLEDVTPMFLSTKGYGVFWDNYSSTLYTDNEDETSFQSESSLCIDYYFIYGACADSVIAQVRALTGQVPMMPLWSYGFMQSRERYKSQDEIVSVVANYRKLRIPIDCIVQDWQYWGNNYLWNAMEFLNANYSEPKRMVDSIHSLNARLMISVWQSFGPYTKPYKELKDEGLLFDFETWPQSGVEIWPPRMDYPSGVQAYNPYNKRARDIYWKYLKQGLFDLGVDAWWMDSTDPDHFNRKPQDFDYLTELGTFRSLRNAFPLMCVRGVYEHQRATTNEKRVFILTRSGFLGQQRYAANVWTGDVQSSWDSFRRQIPAGLNYSLLGMPHWNTDLGGFFCGGYNNMWKGISAQNNPLFHELYVRWLQFGVFCPIMRSHGTDAPREFYFYGNEGDPVYDALIDAVKLRYALLPYIYSTSWDVSHNQFTFMRALFMDFTADKQTWDINNEYMFGKAFLVAPVVNAQYTPETLDDNDKAQMPHPDFTQTKTKQIYLPAGTSWYNFWTNEFLEGGQTLTIETMFNQIPLFVRAGSIIPFGPDVQFTSEKAWDKLSIHVYPGADAQFTLYEDEGDNYNYEQGAYSEIPFYWNDNSRTLTIGARKGCFNGMLEKREFLIVMSDGKQTTVNYDGQETIVNKL